MLREFPKVHTAGISSLACFNNATLCVTSLDDTVSLWDLENSKPLCDPLKTHSGSVNSCLFLQDGIRMLTAGDDRSVIVWDQRNGMKEPSFIIKGFGDAINKMCTSTDGTLLYSACDSGLIYVHCLDDPSYPLKYRWMASSQPVNDICCITLEGAKNENGDEISADVIVTGCDDCAIRTWKTGPVDGKPEGTEGEDRMLQSIEEFQQAVNHVTVNKNWVYAVSTTVVMSLQCDLSSGELTGQTRVYPFHQDYVRGCRFFNDPVTGEERMVTVSDDKTAFEWDVVTATPLAGAQLHNDFIMALCLNADRTKLYTGCEDGSVREWSLPLPRNEAFTNQIQQVMQQHKEQMAEQEAEEEQQRQEQGDGDDDDHDNQNNNNGDDEDDAAPPMQN